MQYYDKKKYGTLRPPIHKFYKPSLGPKYVSKRRYTQ